MSGYLLILQHIVTICSAIILLGTFVIIGLHILRYCGLSLTQPLESLLFSLALGAGLLATTILICGFTLGFSRLVCASLVILTVLLCRKTLPEGFRIIRQSVSCFREHTAPWAVAAVGVIAGYLILKALSPPTNWDGFMYHLRVPVLFLQKGGIYLPEDNMHTAFVQLAHMWYIPLLAFGGLAGPAVVSAFFAIALSLAVFTFCLQYLDRTTASLSMVILWGSTVIIVVAVTSRVDVTVAYFLFLGQYALISSLLDIKKWPFFYLAAVLLGISIGIKYNALFYLVALSPLIWWVAWTHSRSYRNFLKDVFFFYFVVIAVISPWLIKNIYLFKSFYPFYPNPQLVPWLTSLLDDPQSAIQTMKKIKIAVFSHFQFNLTYFIFYPKKIMIEYEARFYFFNFILLFALYGIFIRDRILNWLLVPSLFFIFLISCYHPYSNYRYLIPVVPFMTIVASKAFWVLCTGVKQSRIGAFA